MLTFITIIAIIILLIILIFFFKVLLIYFRQKKLKRISKVYFIEYLESEKVQSLARLQKNTNLKKIHAKNSTQIVGNLIS